ncbi:Subtilisin-like protease [Rhynchospora pubera]|uniref:Subtilisin-like protease n=1 Tax=Rhynchospora pubera TaxID=906938 RepID=A0AAV8BRX2_9POAL|nr:Subtilisin-like protease [Rhynchospora pubera]
MASILNHHIAIVCLLSYISFSTFNFVSSISSSTYIVYVNPSHKPAPYHTHAAWHAALLQSLTIEPSYHLLYSYSSNSAFAASLLPHHVPLLASHSSTLHIHPDTFVPLLTTRSPTFLGLPPYLSSVPSSNPSMDVIVGVLDTGVWPEHPSFSDAGFSAVPSRWRGKCESGPDFSSSVCNLKLIGARSFSRGYQAAGGNTSAASPRDLNGHGTHTATTAAGSPVANASLFGYASGIARGMAPGARVAVYKVCWTQGCYGSDILAGINGAIADGVDVLSMSLGGGSAPFFRDPVAVGTFSAIQRGIFVACSAGNSGPTPSSLTNTAPWIATVGAGSLDRDFPAYAQLGNGKQYTGVSLCSGEWNEKEILPIVYNKGVQVGSNSSKLCLPGTLDSAQVKGKVVLCERGMNARVEKGLVVKEAGGVGMILVNQAANGEELLADSHILPAIAVGAKNADIIRNYVLSDQNPTVQMSFAGTVLNVKPSPVVAAFSSRGPSTLVPELLKPDMIGPGLNILAGWTKSVAPSGLTEDERQSDFNIVSGTSMSCPHIGGLSALLKAAHPDWSPGAIKSALMTTAYMLDNTGSPLHDSANGTQLATPWAYGSGHVDPVKALSPGLIYNTTTEDYIAFLCTLGYTIQQIQVITSSNSTCSHKLSTPGNLNYPSFSVVFGQRSRQVVKYQREVTNVGPAGSIYNVQVTGPASVSVSVKPQKLAFRQVGQKLRFTVTFKSVKVGSRWDAEFGWLTWNNGHNQVRSPIAYTWNY